MAGNESNRAGDGRAGQESFLARWSRRKQAAQHGPAPQAETGEEAEPPAVDEAAGGVAADSAAADPGEAGAHAEALPHPDTLAADSDFSAYLTGRVSSAFRRAAMRRLFSQPEFNVKDGLDDYDEDYTQFRSLGETVTAHMRHRAERAHQREQEGPAEREGAAPAEDEPASTPAAREDQPSAPTDEPDGGDAGGRHARHGDDDDAG